MRRHIDKADDARLTAIRDMFYRQGYGTEDAFIPCACGTPAELHGGGQGGAV
jgi:hypothetical protein